MPIRPARRDDDDALWAILEPTFRTGDSYRLPRDIGRPAALAYWRAEGNSVFVFEDGARILGSYYLRANAESGGMVANCGYATAPAARGRGIARAMCRHSLDEARAQGFQGMQFNFVVSTNAPAVKLWQDCGFAIVQRLPGAFAHPARGPVDALVMYRAL